MYNDNRQDDKNNKCFISGLIEAEFVYAHDVFEEKFYKTRVKVMRSSGNIDYVPVMVSERLLYGYMNQKLKDRYVEVFGQIRTYNKISDDGRNRLEVYLFAFGINFYESADDYGDLEQDANAISLKGAICKPPVYRMTPFGRYITDVFVAVNRKYGKSDYIPCIFWGRNAQYMSQFLVGTKLELLGRFQSREYFKRFYPDSDEGETRIAYEVSVHRVNVVESVERFNDVDEFDECE